MTEDNQEERRGVGRPRSVESHQAILDATLEMLAEEGFHGTSIEAIAARAGVGKSTIYRRWSTKDELIADALGELHVHMKFVDTGHFRADLLTSLREMQHHIETHALLKGLFLRLFGEAQARPEFMQIFYNQVFAPRITHVIHFFAQAQARGELRQDLEPFFIASLVLGPLLHNLLIGSLLPMPYSTQKLPEHILDAVLQGIGTERSGNEKLGNKALEG